WNSSMFGVIIVCSQGLTALAAATAFAARLPAANRAPLLRDLGNLILAASLLHAYVSFSQFFIIWNGDVPERTSWYIPRTRGLWLIVIISIALIQFAIPLAIVLFRPLKTSPKVMIAVAALLLLGSALESAWLTIPSAPYDGTATRLLYPLLA